MRKLCPFCRHRCWAWADVCAGCGREFADPGHAQYLAAFHETWFEWIAALVRGRDVVYEPPPNRTGAGKAGVVLRGWRAYDEPNQLGRVRVSGEIWRAKSRWREDRFEEGDEIRVTGRDGLMLIVEQVHPR